MEFRAGIQPVGLNVSIVTGGEGETPFFPTPEEVTEAKIICCSIKGKADFILKG